MSVSSPGITSFERGPFLSAVLVCEKVLTEQDGVKSAIRIIDRVTRTIVAPNPPETMEAFDYDLALLVKFKSGWARGPYALRIELAKPSMEKLPSMEQQILFEGEEDRGIDVVANIRIRLEMIGIYWFRVYLGDTLVTQVPLRIIYSPTRQTHGAAGGPTRDQ